jgi:predicted PurR-regulated permease PerM
MEHPIFVSISVGLILMLKYIKIMENESKPHEIIRNPETHQAHRREVFWQITLPFIFGALIFLGLAIAASWGAIGEVRTWGDISVIWLILLTFVPGLLMLIVLVVLIYGVSWLVIHLPEYALQMQNVFQLFSRRAKQIADKTVEPVMRVESARASLKSIFRK